MSETQRRSRIENFIQQLDSANTEKPQQHLNILENDSDSEDDPDTELCSSSLAEIESFIPSSQAFEDLIDSLKNFLKLSWVQDVPPSITENVQSQMAREPLQTDSNKPLLTMPESSTESSSIPLPKLDIPDNSIWLRVYEILSNRLTRMERPKAGLHRIQYTCVRSSRNLCQNNHS